MTKILDTIRRTLRRAAGCLCAGVGCCTCGAPTSQWVYWGACEDYGQDLELRGLPHAQGDHDTTWSDVFPGVP
jgi:hypothetical protein